MPAKKSRQSYANKKEALRLVKTRVFSNLFRNLCPDVELDLAKGSDVGNFLSFLDPVL